MKKMKKLYAKMGAAMTAAMCTVTQAFATSGGTGSATTGSQFDTVVNPVIGLIDNVLGPLLAIVGALGAPYCVILGVRYAKAQEPQEREKAKSNLKNALIGFVLIFVMLVVLKLLMPVMQTWVTKSTTPPTT